MSRIIHNRLHVTGAVNANTGQPKANCQCSTKTKPAQSVLTPGLVSWLNAQRKTSELLSSDFLAYANRQAKGGR
jgi:hypothetical protein